MRPFVEKTYQFMYLAYLDKSWWVSCHGNIPRWGISQLGISLVSSELVYFSIN